MINQKKILYIFDVIINEKLNDISSIDLLISEEKNELNERLYYFYLTKLNKLVKDFNLTDYHKDIIKNLIKFYEKKEEYKRCSLLKSSMDIYKINV